MPSMDEATAILRLADGAVLVIEQLPDGHIQRTRIEPEGRHDVGSVNHPGFPRQSRAGLFGAFQTRLPPESAPTNHVACAPVDCVVLLFITVPR